MLVKASSSAEVHGFVSRFPVHLSSDGDLDKSATERGYDEESLYYSVWRNMYTEK